MRVNKGMTEGPSGTPSDKAPVADLQSRLISPCLIASSKMAKT
jgi:hypothetical protein